MTHTDEEGFCCSGPGSLDDDKPKHRDKVRSKRSVACTKCLCNNTGAAYKKAGPEGKYHQVPHISASLLFLKKRTKPRDHHCQCRGSGLPPSVPLYGFTCGFKLAGLGRVCAEAPYSCIVMVKPINLTESEHRLGVHMAALNTELGQQKAAGFKDLSDSFQTDPAPQHKTLLCPHPSEPPPCSGSKNVWGI